MLLALACLPATACGPGSHGGGEDEDAAAEGTGPAAEVMVSAPGAAELAWGDTAREVRGLWVRLAEAPTLAPCGTDVVLPVADGEAADSLARAVGLAGRGAGEATLVRIRARLAEEPGGRVLRVETVLDVGTEATCPEAPAPPPLEETAWQLTGLPRPDDVVVGLGAWMRLREEGTVLEGFTGCRELTGRYEWEGTRLRFRSLERSAGACPAAALHAELVEALARAGSYRLRADTLELLGESGAVATFRAPGG